MKWFLTLTLFLMSSQLLAHQKKEAISRIIFNERTQSIEIIHRFLIHDAEHAAKKLFNKNADIIDDEKTQQQFSDYVMSKFILNSLSSEHLPLDAVGFEIDGRYIWIYQETPLRTKLKGLIITHNALRDIWAEQVNLVNVERKKQVRSVIFKGSLRSQRLAF